MIIIISSEKIIKFASVEKNSLFTSLIRKSYYVDISSHVYSVFIKKSFLSIL